jgi:NAD(P)-dependent dehydrogenase (short-subunit alcohol dehydrogenase family)
MSISPEDNGAMAFVIDPALLGLVDEIALVTGAGAGIGRGYAVQLARAGCHIAIAERDVAAGRRTAEEVERLGRRALVIEADVRDPDRAREMVEAVTEAFGKLDIAVNNVGGGLAGKPFLEYDLALWEDVVARNLKSAFVCCRAEARAMIDRQIAGRIINVASTSGVGPSRNAVAYGAAKAGVIQMTKTIALELAPHGIRVNCIIPGTHVTERNRLDDADEEVRRHWAGVSEAIPLGHLGDPMETGGLAVVFASRLTAYVTGQSLISDGGVTLTSARPAARLRDHGNR